MNGLEVSKKNLFAIKLCPSKLKENKPNWHSKVFSWQVLFSDVIRVLKLFGSKV